jgi:glucosamine-6-phosphate deaminase
VLVLLEPDFALLSREAARIVVSAVKSNPSLKLGLATGSSTLGMYAEIIRIYREASLDFSRVTTFNLDEYLGIAPDHPQSFHFFMRENFFRHINVHPTRTHIPDGMITGNYEEYCSSYEQEIRAAGGIDLQILGIGRNGHIGFNEPASSLASRTRLKVLSRETIEDNRKSFIPGEEIPDCAITMGIGTILDTRRILILATGETKADAVAQAIEGPISASVTASSLQLHPDVTFIIDEQAASKLKHQEYYRRVMEVTASFVTDRSV